MINERGHWFLIGLTAFGEQIPLIDGDRFRLILYHKNVFKVKKGHFYDAGWFDI